MFFMREWSVIYELERYSRKRSELILNHYHNLYLEVLLSIMREPQRGHSASRLRFKPMTFRIWSMNDNSSETFANLNWTVPLIFWRNYLKSLDYFIIWSSLQACLSGIYESFRYLRGSKLQITTWRWSSQCLHFIYVQCITKVSFIYLSCTIRNVFLLWTVTVQGSICVTHCSAERDPGKFIVNSEIEFFKFIRKIEFKVQSQSC
jgi:hypothetical protein